MKRTIQTLISGLSLALSAVAFAQPMGGGMNGMGGMGGMGLGSDRPCARADAPAQCAEMRKKHQEIRQQAVEACKDLVGPDRRRCIRDIRMSAQDCSKTAQPDRCKAVQSAYGQCKESMGPALRQCMHDKLPPPDCSKAPDPKVCEDRQKAREACKEKAVGPDRGACVKDQLGKQ